ncbi:hypothetical protein K2X33_08875 [bacterium]|nr:hypothetical protein [bacterium]
MKKFLFLALFVFAMAFSAKSEAQGWSVTLYGPTTYYGGYYQPYYQPVPVQVVPVAPPQQYYWNGYAWVPAGGVSTYYYESVTVPVRPLRPFRPFRPW